MKRLGLATGPLWGLLDGQMKVVVVVVAGWRMESSREREGVGAEEEGNRRREHIRGDTRAYLPTPA